MLNKPEETILIFSKILLTKKVLLTRDINKNVLKMLDG